MNRAQRTFLGVLSAAALLAAAVLVAQQDRPSDNTVGSAKQTGLADTVIVNGVAEPLYRSMKGIVPPRQIYSPPPDYSNEARKRKIEGVVTLAAVVTSAGQTTQIRVLTSRGYGLDEKAIEAVRKWKFKPATRDGVPVSVEMALEISFHLYHNR
jgi:TonB family protein